MDIRSSKRSPARIGKRFQVAKRRSVRVTLGTVVGLSGCDRQNSAFTMRARATNLNQYGAALQLDRELPVGSTVVVRNQCGAEISARVVSLISAVEGKNRTYGIEFIERHDQTENFWGITFPTA